jgi:ABC-type amino acid transport substrate-binding protein
MKLLNKPEPATVHKLSTANPVPLKPGQSRLDRIQEQGVVRVGFNRDDLPFSYFNNKGELVGLDIDLAHRLAGDMGVRIDFVPFRIPFLAEQLADDHFDIAMSGLGATGRRATELWLSQPYMNATMALVVRDHDREVFSDLERIKRLPSFSLGMLSGAFFKDRILDSVPRAKIVELWSLSQFFESPPEHMDALLTSAEGGSAWTLLYPEYQVVNPLPRRSRLPLAFPYGGPDPEFRNFLDAWIQEQIGTGTVEKLYDHWILGKGAEVRGRRWSVIRDVLHWVD